MAWAVLAAAMYAFYQMSTRSLSETDRPVTTVFYTALLGVVIMSFAVFFFWKTPGWTTAKLMCMTGVLSGFAHYAIIRALQVAPASVISPFGYTGVLWAIVFGFVVFAEVPSMGTLIGAAIIVGSGIYIARVESGRRHVI
jgi:drug/metabolite transporter (DMT)-like permease